MQTANMSREPAWKRSLDEALAGGQEREQMSKSNVASLEDNSDEELIIKKQVKHVTFLAYGDSDKKSRANQTELCENKQKIPCTAVHTVDTKITEQQSSAEPLFQHAALEQESKAIGKMK